MNRARSSRARRVATSLFLSISLGRSWLFALLLLLLAATGAAACPACKDAITAGQNQASTKLARGYARSIYLLMATPYLLFGGLALTIARLARKKNSAHDP